MDQSILGHPTYWSNGHPNMESDITKGELHDGCVFPQYSEKVMVNSKWKIREVAKLGFWFFMPVNEMATPRSGHKCRGVTVHPYEISSQFHATIPK